MSYISTTTEQHCTGSPGKHRLDPLESSALYQYPRQMRLHSQKCTASTCCNNIKLSNEQTTLETKFLIICLKSEHHIFKKDRSNIIFPFKKIYNYNQGCNYTTGVPGFISLVKWHFAMPVFQCGLGYLITTSRCLGGSTK